MEGSGQDGNKEPRHDLACFPWERRRRVRRHGDKRLEPDAIATEQEMSFIARAVANGQRSWDSVNFYDSEGDQLERPTEPNWPVDFPRTDPEEGLGGLP